MANIPSSRAYFNDVEISADAPVTTQLLTRIGGAINYLNDQPGNAQVFTVSGVFVVPSGVKRLVCLGCGGGGGGGGSGSSSGSPSYYGNGGGGGGAVPTMHMLAVNPGESYAVAIGSGGAGGAGQTGGIPPTDGSSGGTTSITGPSGNLYFYGGAGGTAPLSITGSQGGYSAIGGLFHSSGGSAYLVNWDDSIGIRVTSSAGQASLYASGGVAGAVGYAGIPGGGGGGAGRGAGGAGGAYATSGNGVGFSGASAAANSGAGGGGGGAGSGPGGSSSGAGGSGGSGIFMLIW